MAKLQYGDLCRATCTAPARYVEDGWCLFVSASCNDLGVDHAQPAHGGEAQMPLPTDSELEAAHVMLVALRRR